MEKESFVFRKEWRDALSGLPAEVRLEVYDAIVEYGLSGRLSDLKPMARLAFGFVKSCIDGDVEREEHKRRVSLARSEAGKKGMSHRWNESRCQHDATDESDNKTDVCYNKPITNDNNVITKNNKTAKENEKKAETPPTPPKEEIKDKEKPHVQYAGAYGAFLSWLESTCPYLHKNLKLPTEAEFMKMRSAYTSESIADCCIQMENRKDLRKNYVSLYRTLLNWLKRRENGTNRNYNQRPTPADNIRAAQESCYRDMAATLVGTAKE